MPPTAKNIRQISARLASKERAHKALRFFKSSRGEYAEGDRFLGISVPPLRQLVIRLRDVSLAQIAALLASSWHEVSQAALTGGIDSAFNFHL